MDAVENVGRLRRCEYLAARVRLGVRGLREEMLIRITVRCIDDS
jgi:hypothetical protein